MRAYLALDFIQQHKPGVRLTYGGKPTKHVRKSGHAIATGLALGTILGRPELACLKGAEALDQTKDRWEYRQNLNARGQLQKFEETRPGYQYETAEVRFWEQDDRGSFRTRSGHRGHALRAIDGVLDADEFNDIRQIQFLGSDSTASVDLGADPQHWQ